MDIRILCSDCFVGGKNNSTITPKEKFIMTIRGRGVIPHLNIFLCVKNFTSNYGRNRCANACRWPLCVNCAHSFGVSIRC